MFLISNLLIFLFKFFLDKVMNTIWKYFSAIENLVWHYWNFFKAYKVRNFCFPIFDKVKLNLIVSTSGEDQNSTFDNQT